MSRPALTPCAVNESRSVPPGQSVRGFQAVGNLCRCRQSGRSSAVALSVDRIMDPRVGSMIPPPRWVLFSSIWRDVRPWVVQGCEGVFDVVGHVQGHLQGCLEGLGQGVVGGWQGLGASLRA